MAVERRSHPRFPVDFSLTARVSNEEDKQPQAFSGQAATLSRTSIQFSCDDSLVSALLKQQTLPFTCDLEFKLPWHERVFRMPAQVITHRRVSQHRYVLVMLFRHDNEAQEQLLEELLDKRLAAVR